MTSPPKEKVLMQNANGDGGWSLQEVPDALRHVKTRGGIPEVVVMKEHPRTYDAWKESGSAFWGCPPDVKLGDWYKTEDYRRYHADLKNYHYIAPVGDDEGSDEESSYLDESKDAEAVVDAISGAYAKIMKGHLKRMAEHETQVAAMEARREETQKQVNRLRQLFLQKQTIKEEMNTISLTIVLETANPGGGLTPPQDRKKKENDTPPPPEVVGRGPTPLHAGMSRAQENSTRIQLNPKARNYTFDDVKQAWANLPKPITPTRRLTEEEVDRIRPHLAGVTAPDPRIVEAHNEEFPGKESETLSVMGGFIDSYYKDEFPDVRGRD